MLKLILIYWKLAHFRIALLMHLYTFVPLIWLWTGICPSKFTPIFSGHFGLHQRQEFSSFCMDKIVVWIIFRYYNWKIRQKCLKRFWIHFSYLDSCSKTGEPCTVKSEKEMLSHQILLLIGCATGSKQLIGGWCKNSNCFAGFLNWDSCMKHFT